MSTQVEIENAVVVWVAAATGATTIIADQAKPRPATPYATVKVSGFRAIGFDDKRGITDPGAPAEGVQTYRGDREVTVSVNVIGSGALDLARAAANSLMQRPVRDQLATAGLCHRGIVPTVNDLTGLLDTTFQPRAQFDVRLGLADDHTASVPLVEDVTVEATLTRPERDDITKTIQVSKP